MKILLINATDYGSGAANACFRLMEALQGEGHDANILVQKQKGDDHPAIQPLLSNKLEKVPYLIRVKYQQHLLRAYKTNYTFNFSVPLSGRSITNHPLVQEAEVLHLHYLNDVFIGLKNLRQLALLRKPIIITLHDMWLFTGGCHYSGTCERYLTHCHQCPVLNSHQEQDLSWKIFEQKSATFPEVPFSAVTPSSWLASEAQRSHLLSRKQVQALPNGINTNSWKPLPMQQALDYFELEEDGSFRILFGGVKSLVDDRKGFPFLLEALDILGNKRPDLKEKVRLVIFGVSEEESPFQFPFPVTYLGRLTSEEALLHCYNLGHGFVLPTLEDNLPNTLMEANACGVPSVAFRVGGVPELVEHQRTGYLAEPQNSDDLAFGLAELISRGGAGWGKEARLKAEREFSYQQVARQHLELYQQLLR